MDQLTIEKIYDKIGYDKIRDLNKDSAANFFGYLSRDLDLCSRYTQDYVAYIIFICEAFRTKELSLEEIKINILNKELISNVKFPIQIRV